MESTRIKSTRTESARIESARIKHWNESTNKPNMSPLEATEGQKRLYDTYNDPLPYVVNGERLMVIRVPIDVQKGFYEGPCGVLVRHHGGGNTTGTPDSEVFYKAHIRGILEALPIVLDLSNLMLPHHSGTESHSDQDDIYTYIKDGRVEAAIRREYPQMKSLIQWEGILCIGESAGGHWTTYAWLKQHLNIKVIYNMYPLLVHYSRGKSDKYRGEVICPDRLQTIGLQLLKEAALTRPYRPQNRGRCPPANMANLPITAVWILSKRNKGTPKLENLWTLLWSHPMTLDFAQAIFDKWPGSQEKRNVHSEDTHACKENVSYRADMVVVEAEDVVATLGLELLGKLGLEYHPEDRALSYNFSDPDIPPPSRSPKWVFVHNEQDPFVSIQDVEKFSNILQSMYGDVVHWVKVADSHPLHGFDDYPGSKEVVKLILEEMEWTPRLVRE